MFRKNTGFIRRKIRTRSKISGTHSRPRLTVYKSNKYLTAQLVDDQKSTTLTYVSSKNFGKIDGLGKSGMDKAKEVGVQIAKKALAKKIKSAVFDKGGYKYHGKVKAVADGAREGGLLI